MIVLVLISQDVLSSLDRMVGLPKIRNSVLEGLSESRLADIHVETLNMED